MRLTFSRCESHSIYHWCAGDGAGVGGGHDGVRLRVRTGGGFYVAAVGWFAGFCDP